MKRELLCEACANGIELNKHDARYFMMRVVRIKACTKPKIHDITKITIMGDALVSTVEPVPLVCDHCNKALQDQPGVAVTMWSYINPEPGEWEKEYDQSNK